MTGLSSVSAASEAAAKLSLRPGCAWFRVEELPAYAPSGSGEHLYIEIEKEDLTTDQVINAVARRFNLPRHAIGYAGRKDRRAVTRQWLSLHRAEAWPTDESAATITIPGGRCTVLRHSRHGNKLRTGHLIGNRFELGIDGIADAAAFTQAVQRLAAHGMRNRFGFQRFGRNGATLAAAIAWGRGDDAGAVEWAVDADHRWRWGDPLPNGFRSGPEGLVIAALRKGADARTALRRSGEDYRKLLASAAQAAVFNAVAEARHERGLVHTLRAGDIACTTRGAPFAVTAEDCADVNRRAATGVLDIRATGPLPGNSGLSPAADILAEEHTWSAATGVDWAWFGRDGIFSSPGERRPLLMSFVEPPVLTAPSSPDQPYRLTFALPAGGYATEVLAQLGVEIPGDRSSAADAQHSG